MRKRLTVTTDWLFGLLWRAYCGWWNFLCRVELHDWDWANADIDKAGTWHLKCTNPTCSATGLVRKEQLPDYGPP